MLELAKRLSLTALLAALALAPANAQQVQRYRLDRAGSQVTARVSFFGLASKTARFPQLTGGITLTPSDLRAITLDVAIDARALSAGDQVTLSRLKGPNFFDVERYPTVRFAGRSMRMTGVQTADISGQLTARGVTRPAVLHVIFDRAPSAQSVRQPIQLTGEMKIDRRDFGMTAYPFIVGRQVTIALRVRMMPA